MRKVRFGRQPTLMTTLAIAAVLSGCSGDTDSVATAAIPPDSAAAAPVGNAAPTPDGTNSEVRFTSGTSYAATGAQAEIALSVTDARARDVLEQIATAGGVPVDIADGVTLDHTVSLHFDGMPLSAVLTLLGQDANAEITADADAIRVRPRATPSR